MTKKLIVPIASDHLDKLIEQRRVDANRIRELEAALKEAELQRDTWKRITESGLGITAETICDPSCTAPTEGDCIRDGRSCRETGTDHGK